MISLVREFTFDSAHNLRWNKGKCKNIHGHTYKLQVFVTGKLNKNGIIIDLKDLDKLVKKEVIELLDHTYINKIVENPTLENLSIWIWKRLKKRLNNLHELRIWETPKSFVVYTGE